MPADLKEIRDLYTHDEAEWAPIRAEGTTDMQYAAGDPWDPKDRRAREKANRPCINADELSQYVNQVVNEVRSNKRAVKFTPIGNGATDQSAQFYADKMREIEYRSRAQIGYTTAFENCVQRSFGWVRVNSRYAHSRAVNQDIWIDPIPNPNLVTPDTYALMPDGSDMQHCWVREAWSLDDFNRKWQKNRIARFTSDLAKLAFGWVNERRVFVGEHWKITTKTRKLLIVQPPAAPSAPGQPPQGQPDPIGIFEDELDGQPLPGTLLKDREVDDPSVIMQLTNGLDILEETKWPGKYIPIVGCLGKVLYVDDEGKQTRLIHSMIRLARDPQQLYAYLLTNEAEVIGAMPRFPYFVYEGQLSQKELYNLSASVHEPVAVIQVKASIEGLPPGNGPLGFPQRNPYEPPLMAIEAAKEAARRAIQAAMGQSPLPTAAQRRNEKSGVALKHIDELGQRGSYHFTDHYLDMITQVGIVCEDLMDKIYDTARDVGVRKDDDSSETIRINDPQQAQSVQTKGDHLVTVSTGPSFDSEREAANDFVDSLFDGPVLQIVGPQKAAQIVAKAAKMRNIGPLGDQIADIISPEPGKDGAPSSQQLQQAVQESQGKLQEMGQQLQQAAQIIHEKQVEQQGKIEVAKIEADVAIKKAEIAANAGIAEAEVKAGSQDLDRRLKAVELFLTAEQEARLDKEAKIHEHVQGTLDRAHDVGMAVMAQQHALEQGAIAHQQGLEAQAAAPEPSTTGSGA